jgi:hypothetical protein
LWCSYNLYVGHLFSARWSAFWGVVFPWLVSFLLYQGDGFDRFVTWASLGLNGFINFLVPFVLLYSARKRYGSGTPRPVLSDSVLGSGEAGLHTRPTSLSHSAAAAAGGEAEAGASNSSATVPASAVLRPSEVDPLTSRLLHSDSGVNPRVTVSVRPTGDTQSINNGTCHTLQVLYCFQTRLICGGCAGGKNRALSDAEYTSGTSDTQTSRLVSPPVNRPPPPSPPALLYPISMFLGVAIVLMLFTAIGLEIYSESTQSDEPFVCKNWVH